MNTAYMLHQAKNAGLCSSLQWSKWTGSPTLDCTFDLAGEITRAEYATVN